MKDSKTIWPSDSTRDHLIGDWFLYQRKRGHRSSTDDLITAWFASRVHASPPTRYLDLGCGIGSVLFLTAHRLRPQISIGVEAQAQSVLLARRTREELSDPPEIKIFHADFREIIEKDIGKFSLITGSPPYLPLGTGILSPDPQRAACRFELRGGIEDYCATASSLLTKDGVFCVVFQKKWESRVLLAGEKADLFLSEKFELSTVKGDPAFLAVYAFARNRTANPKVISMAMRNKNRSVTADYQQLRAELGLRMMILS